MIPPQPNTDKWGRRGSRIKDSNLVRDYCRVCAEPIRVTMIAEGANSPACNCCADKDRTRGFQSVGSWRKLFYLADNQYHGDYYRG